METNENNPLNGQQSTESTATRKGQFDNLISAIRKGSEDAKKAAERAIPKIKAAASQADYWAGYGIAFATVFSATVVRQFTPESVKSGVRDGVKAGKAAAEGWVETLKHPKSSPEPVALIGSSSQDSQPGAA